MKSPPLIISRHASRARAFLDRQEPILERFDVKIVADPVSLRTALAEAAEVSDIVVVGGGDGTISFAARLLTNTPKTLAILPLGTTNNFARSIGYEKQPPEKLLDFYLKKKDGENELLIDIGTSENGYFLNVCSIGLSGQIAQEVDSHKKKLFGRLAYFFQAFKVLWKAKPFTVKYTCDEQSGTVPAYQILIFNGTHHAGIKVRKRSFLQNGKLYVVLFGGATPVHYLFQFLAFLAGYPRPSTKRFPIKECALSLGSEQPMEMDGEPKVFQSGTFTVKHASLKVVKLPPLS